MDEKVGDRVNVLNSARYRTRQRQMRLHDLQMQYKQFGDDDDDDGDGGEGSEGAGSGGGAGAGKRGDADSKADTAKSGDIKDDDVGQVTRLLLTEGNVALHTKLPLILSEITGMVQRSRHCLQSAFYCE